MQHTEQVLIQKHFIFLPENERESSEKDGYN